MPFPDTQLGRLQSPGVSYRVVVPDAHVCVKGLTPTDIKTEVGHHIHFDDSRCTNRTQVEPIAPTLVMITSFQLNNEGWISCSSNSNHIGVGIGLAAHGEDSHRIGNTVAEVGLDNTPEVQ